jgi:hypothetical protein
MSLNDCVCEQPFPFTCTNYYSCLPCSFSVYLICFKAMLLILLYFQGGKIRAKLVAELNGAEGVVIEEGAAGEEGKAAAENGMRK